MRSSTSANSRRFAVGTIHSSPRPYSRGSIATNSPMTMIMNRLVSAPSAVPTHDVSRPTDPSAWRMMLLMSDDPGITPLAVSHAVDSVNCRTAQEWVNCSISCTPVR